MRNLLEIKEIIKRVYGKYDVYIMPVLKLVLALVTFFSVNKQLGYMTRINNGAIVVMAALLCSFLPTGFIIFFAAVFMLLHCYSLAMEVALVVFCLFLVIALLVFRFSPKDSLMIIVTPLLFGLKVPYLAPLSMGLIGTPASAVTVGCGVIIYYLVSFISVNAPSISAIDAAEAVARLRMVIDGILDNKEMLVMIAAFAFTVVVVYTIRRLSIDHSWTIAMVAGVFVNAVILLLGDLMYDISVSVLGILFGSLISLGLCVVLQFFIFSVDYTRTEKVQFEDDEYYYYVKAVPKMTVAAPEKTVKRINAQVGRTSHAGSVHQPVRNVAGPKASGRQAPSRTISTRESGYTNRNIELEEETDDYEEF